MCGVEVEEQAIEHQALWSQQESFGSILKEAQFQQVDGRLCFVQEEHTGRQ
jgi:hypothetical protein